MTNANRITLDYYGIEGTGPTIKAAKEEAGEKIREIVNADARPELFSAPNGSVVGMVYFLPRSGYVYALAPSFPELSARMRGHSTSYCGTSDRKEAVRLAKVAAASYGLDAGKLSTYRDAVTWLHSMGETRAIGDVVRNLEFQLAYIAARDANPSLGTCDFHRIACGTSESFRSRAEEIVGLAELVAA